MSDGFAHRCESSPEQVAFRLMLEIAKVENKAFTGHPRLRGTAPDRQWVLDTFSECLEAVRGNRPVHPAKANSERAACDSGRARVIDRLNLSDAPVEGGALADKCWGGRGRSFGR